MTDRPDDTESTESAEPGPPALDEHLRSAGREIEAHAADAGWDQPARLFALVPTRDLLAREPGLATALGLTEAEPGALTPVEQEPPAEHPLEETLGQIMWPPEVFGCAAVVERLVLPPEADAEMPQEPQAAQDYAAAHPDRQEMRIVAAVTRDGSNYCALRMRAHDDAGSVLEGEDLVPGLLELLHGTLSQ